MFDIDELLDCESLVACGRLDGVGGAADGEQRNRNYDSHRRPPKFT
jgi:hypothetical protein